MSIPFILDPHEWAEKLFSQIEIGDKRRTARAVAMAGQIMRQPNASLPNQMRSPEALKAAYRLLAEEDVTYRALIVLHWQQTRQAAEREQIVLIVEDTTHVDYTHHPQTTGLGPIGDGEGQGFLLHSAIAVVPAPRRVLGLMYQEPFLREPAPGGETSAQRQKRERESQVWARTVKAIGQPPEDSCWVHVGDRGSDIFEFIAACRQYQSHFLIRVVQNRRVEVESAVGEDSHLTYLVTYARSLPARGEKTIDIPARQGHPARQARLAISFGRVTIQPPFHHRKQAPIPAWVIRAWEIDPPSDVEEPLEWILVTSVPTDTLSAAQTRLEWYAGRWLAEDYHQCLKTGCSLEKRQLQTGEGLFRLLGFLAPVAIRLLQLREIARLEPERLATDALPQELVNVVALLAGVSSETLTLGHFWRQVAGFGGYLGRRRDGPPGWKTLWRGWLYVQTVLEGIQLAARLPP